MPQFIPVYFPFYGPKIRLQCDYAVNKYRKDSLKRILTFVLDRLPGYKCEV